MIHIDREFKVAVVLVLVALALVSSALAAKRPHTGFARLAAFSWGLPLLFAGVLFLFTDHKMHKPEVLRFLLGIIPFGIGGFIIWCGFTKTPAEIHDLFQKTRLR